MWNFYRPRDVANDYGTALPSSPVDGQMFTLVDSITNPTYSWRFRYNAGSSNTDKWEFVGGSPLAAEIAAAESTASTTYVALTTPGPVVAIPRSGVYEIELAARMVLGATASGLVYMSYDIGGTGAVDADALQHAHALSNDDKHASRKTIRSFTAVTLTAKYKVAVGTHGLEKRRISVVPVRVS